MTKRVLISAAAYMLLAVGVAAQDEHLRFHSTRIAEQLPPVTATAIGPDGHLYFATVTGEIHRRQLHQETGLPVGPDELLYDDEDDNILGITFDLTATAENLSVWTSFNGNDLDAPFRSKLALVNLPQVESSGAATRQDYIVGLPTQNTGNRDHQLNQSMFGPDGRLYFNVGATSYEGDEKEVPLSAATLVADVRDPDFLDADEPIDVNTSYGYDPFAPDAKVTIHASGVRNAYDLVWHSNGRLYAPINGNDSGGQLLDDPDTPANEAVSAPSGAIPEQLATIVEGGYYGHPNPSRGEYISHGGNTGANDPWQVTAYPFPTQPEPNWVSDDNFDLVQTIASPSLSPDGIAEYTGPTRLNGHLLIAYFAARSDFHRVEAFRLDANTGRVVDFSPLLDEAGSPLELSQPLDLTVESESGRIYVGSYQGDIYLLSPVFFGADFDLDMDVDGQDFLTWQRGHGITSGASLTQGDADADGDVDSDDLAAWQAQYSGFEGSPLGTRIPEPSSMILVLTYSLFERLRIHMLRKTRQLVTTTYLARPLGTL